MINIDSVYQKVLVLANKEQRGYLTPQEFNLFADKAQKEIFDSYFHDVKTAYHKPKNKMGAAFDEIEILQEKLHAFRRTSTITPEAGSTSIDLPSNLYLIDVFLKGDVEVTELTKKEIAYTQNNSLTAATVNRPVYVRENNTFTNNISTETIRIYPTPTEGTTYTLHYYQIPSTPRWGYVVVQGKALFNNSVSHTVNFQLHESEEEVLVSRILQLAGITIMKPGIVEIGAAEKTNIKAEQNN